LKFIFALLAITVLTLLNLGAPQKQSIRPARARNTGLAQWDFGQDFVEECFCKQVAAQPAKQAQA
jgi:hypothetical protein